MCCVFQFGGSTADDDLAWATMSSKADYEEAERRRKQEEEDFQLALKLSQQDASSEA